MCAWLPCACNASALALRARAADARAQAVGRRSLRRAVSDALEDNLRSTAHIITELQVHYPPIEHTLAARPPRSAGRNTHRFPFSVCASLRQPSPTFMTGMSRRDIS